MAVACCCMSHSPLIGLCDPSPEIVAEVMSEIDAARRFVGDFHPDVVVEFGVDHLNGFLYNVMPQFCIGTNARAIGDYGTASGPIRVPTDLATDCAAFVIERGFDVAVSAEMVVDHGFAQPVDLLFGGLDRVPLIPVFINAAGPPRSPMSRSRTLGAAVGAWAQRLGERVLLLGSGGLSHDPPVPSLANADAALLDRLLHGVSGDGQARREAATIAVAQEFAAGGSELHRLEPSFDRSFQQLLVDAELQTVDGWDDQWLTANFGRAVHEVRTWVAAFAAMAVSGPYDVEQCYYRAIDEWIAGFGIMTARPRPEGTA